MAHTPGPWEYGREYDSQTVLVGIEIDNPIDGFSIAQVCSGANIQQTIADARLIAAAPDLLEALRVLIADIDSATSLNDFIIGERATRLDATRAAIAKAQGGA